MNDGDIVTEPDTQQLEDRLRKDPAVDADTWRRIEGEFTQLAEREGLIDIAYELHDSPLGPILIAATRDGLVRIGLPIESEDAVMEDLSMRISGRILRAPSGTIDQARYQLDEYFQRERTEFDLVLDWRLISGFRRQVLFATSNIAYGRTASYAEVAARAGSPRAFRAAGTALATNPLPIVVPCHRVLLSNGQLGSYRGGTEAKARLIALERGARL